MSELQLESSNLFGLENQSTSKSCVTGTIEHHYHNEAVVEHPGYCAHNQSLHTVAELLQLCTPQPAEHFKCTTISQVCM